MDIKTFQNLSTSEVAYLVRSAGPKVCVFTLNGTRRWFLLEHAPTDEQDFASAYVEAISKRYIELCQLLYNCGIDTILMPALSPHLMQRGNSYVRMAAQGIIQLTDHPQFLDFYESNEIRVRFYGDYRQCLAATPYAYLSEKFAQLTSQTLKHQRRRLFWGVCAHDATETTADLAIRYFKQHGAVPDKQTLIEMYYGEYIPPVDIYISSGKLHASDMPLIGTGREHLYFSIAPSPYLTEMQFRSILYDHLYARAKTETTYDHMQPKDWATLQEFYQLNMGKTLGVGNKKEEWGLWYPLPQAILP